MAIVDAILPEFDHEMGTTRRVLERAPEADYGWRPHAKSMSMGQLALHVAEIPGWVSATINESSFDVATGGTDASKAEPSSRSELLATFERNVAAARATIAGKTDAELKAPWSLLRAGQEVFTLPKVAVLRSFLMNHVIHHRGQLSVYLRLRNVAVPAIYGPSADEGAF